MIRTRVGYAGGDSVNPTYHDIDGHSETIQIDYDPTLISYEGLLGVFWDSHNPTTPSLSRQYMSIIFYPNEEQRVLAVESKQLQEQKLG
ncbi:MAG: peptide-methionine (S)-S-oxide reductase, partial [Methanoregulaceae archaeon]|nr:peptide-methionine (S)-S-oxide reductase [Methanoregulaceae archaeon]